MQVSDWQCPVCFGRVNDEPAAVVIPCIIESCGTGNHPICLDCCWAMRAKKTDFDCPICRTPAGRLWPLPFVLGDERQNNDEQVKEKLARAERDLTSLKTAINERARQSKLTMEMFNASLNRMTHIFITMVFIVCVVFIALLILRLIFSFEFIFALAMVLLLIRVIHNPESPPPPPPPRTVHIEYHDVQQQPRYTGVGVRDISNK